MRHNHPHPSRILVHLAYISALFKHNAMGNVCSARGAGYFAWWSRSYPDATYCLGPLTAAVTATRREEAVRHCRRNGGGHLAGFANDELESFFRAEWTRQFGVPGDDVTFWTDYVYDAPRAAWRSEHHGQAVDLSRKTWNDSAAATAAATGDAYSTVTLHRSSQVRARWRREVASTVKAKFVCQSLADACAHDHPCVVAGGRCENSLPFACACPSGKTGENCDGVVKRQATTNCGDVSCVHGTCTNVNSTAECKCDAGWKGRACDAAIRQCSDTMVCSGANEVCHVDRCVCGDGHVRVAEKCVLAIQHASGSRIYASDTGVITLALTTMVALAYVAISWRFMSALQYSEAKMFLDMEQRTVGEY